MTSIYQYSLRDDFPEPHEIDQDSFIADVRSNREIITPISEFGVEKEIVSVGFIEKLSETEVNALNDVVKNYVYVIPNPGSDIGPTGYTGERGEPGPQGNVGPTGPSGTCLSSNYFFAYDTTTQTQTLGSFRDITFNTNAYINGWTHTTGTAIFNCNETALYEFAYTAMITSSVSSNIITIVATDNSNNQIPGSQCNVRVTSASMVIPCTNVFQAQISTGSVIKLRFYPTASNGIVTSTGNATLKTSIQFSCRRLD